MTQAPPHTARPIRILLVEDSLGDERLAVIALERAKVANELHVCRDGEDALDYLHARGPYAARPAPDLVLLDLNLPRKSGFEVLEELKADERLRSIPVVVLTTSSAEEDVARSYHLHANSYITKPVTLDGLAKVATAIDSFWVQIVTLPTDMVPLK